MLVSGCFSALRSDDVAVKVWGSFPSTAAPLGFELTGSNGFLFSVTGQMEGLGQMQSSLVQRQLVDGRPEVQGIALGAALGVEALEDVLAQMRREGRLRVVRAAVDWTGPAALQAAAAQLVEQS